VENHKLGIIVPYRNRIEHLTQFLSEITKYLKERNYDYVIIVVEQDNNKIFNRGKLLNIGSKQAEKMGCDYVVFHDVDMLPINVDYSYSDIPLHLSTNFESNGETLNYMFDTYFGGVTLFPIDIFNKVNGFSNKYWGWGFEDDDLLFRCSKNGVKMDEVFVKHMKGSTNSMMFNGEKTYVKGLNDFNLNDNISIFVTFYPNRMVYNFKKESDVFTIFSIPGYDTSITYNSFLRYTFCTFDSDNTPYHISSNIKTNYKTNICVNIDSLNKTIYMYQDGILVNSIKMKKRFRSYRNSPYFYLGVGDPDRIGNEKYYMGTIDTFIIFSDILNQDEIMEISNGKSIENFSNKITLHYDANHISGNNLTDLSGNHKDGKIYNVKIVKSKTPENKVTKIPNRRKGLFNLLVHEDNGFFNNKWKSQFTRWNQLKFQNEVLKNKNLILNDGLSDLEYTLNNETINNNILTMNVSI
jgi:hypothetical protein